MGLFTKTDKHAKRLKRAASYASGQSLLEGEAMGKRVQAGFESNLSVLGMLGQEGTYTSPGGGGGLLGGGGGPQFGGGSITQDATASGAAFSAAKGSKDFTGKIEGVLDPNAFASQVSKMPIAQIISGQVAEARGLSDPQSAFRQSLEQSIKNPILEGGAEIMRESMRQIKNNAAKGGTARRTALAEAQSMQAIERSNRAVSQQLWQANLAFEGWVRDYQKETVNAAMEFTQGLGVNQYVGAMNAASEFMVKTALPASVQHKETAFRAMQAGKKRTLFGAIVGGALSMIGAKYGGQAGAQALGGIVGGGSPTAYGASSYGGGGGSYQDANQGERDFLAGRGPQPQRTLVGDVKDIYGNISGGISDAGRYLGIGGR